MADITFVKAAESVTIPPHRFGTYEGINSGQVAGVNAADDLYVYQKTTPGKRRWILNFSHLNDTEIGELETFYINRGGPSESFTYTDPFSDSYTVQWQETEFRPNHNSTGFWSIAITLKEV